MADQTLSEQTTLSAITGLETLYVVSNGNTRKTTINAILMAMLGATVPNLLNTSYRGCTARPGTSSIDYTGFSTPQWVTWLEAPVNSDGIWTYGTPTRMTIPAGITKVALKCSVSQAIANISGEIRIYKNGVQIASTTGKLVETSVMSVVADDYFEVVTTKYGAWHPGGVAPMDYFFEMIVCEVTA